MSIITKSILITKKFNSLKLSQTSQKVHHHIRKNTATPEKDITFENYVFLPKNDATIMTKIDGLMGLNKWS